MTFRTIDLASLDEVTGGRGEGILRFVRGGLVAATIASGNPAQQPPRVEPIRIEMPVPTVKMTQGPKG